MTVGIKWFVLISVCSMFPNYVHVALTNIQKLSNRTIPNPPPPAPNPPSVIYFDVHLACVFSIFRDGVVARFVATDGGITRVYPGRYSHFTSPFPNPPVVISLCLFWHCETTRHLEWVGCKSMRWKHIHIGKLLRGTISGRPLLPSPLGFYSTTWKIRHFPKTQFSSSSSRLGSNPPIQLRSFTSISSVLLLPVLHSAVQQFQFA